MPRIITKYDPKPIASRCLDWEAWYEGSDEENGARAFGSSEEEASIVLQDEFPYDGAD